ncbi:MAG: hypothetical protein JWP02_94 [Acidimicrobiales bacterium]|nr:hypothetical protein [Acidimicrobiales bacterium]
MTAEAPTRSGLRARVAAAFDLEILRRRWGTPAERWFPVAATAVLFVFLYGLALLRQHKPIGGYDIAYFQQAAWLIDHGRAPFVTLRGLHLLGDHASPIFYPIAWVAGLGATAKVLLAVQSAALAVGVLPLWSVCRRVAALGAGASAAVVVAYGLYPALNNVNLADFHPEAVAVPALLGAVLFGLRRRWVPYGLCVAVALLCKEDFTIVVASLGLFLLVERLRIPGLVTLAVGGAAFLFDTRILQPHFAGGFVQTAFLSQYGKTLGAIAGTMATDPGRVLGDLLTHQNLNFAIAILAPLLFLPLLAPRYLIPALPMQLLYLVSERSAAHGIVNQYTVAIIPFVFVATAMALGGLDNRRPDRRILGALVIGTLVFNASLSVGGLSGKPWRWRHLDAADRARRAAVRIVPHTAAVSATSRVWPLVAERPAFYGFPNPWFEYHGLRDPIPLDVRLRTTQWIVVDTTDPTQWNAPLADQLGRVVAEQRFTQVFERAGIVVLHRSP